MTRRPVALLVATLLLGAACSDIAEAGPNRAAAIRTPVARAAPCAHPTRLDMTDGHYTTPATLQQGNLFENMDAWSPDPTLQQQMTVCSISRWDVTVTETSTSNTRVVDFPDSEYRWTTYEDCTHSPDWSTLKNFSVKWAMTTPKKGDWDASFDLFSGGTINGHDCGPFQEVMLYTSTHGDVYAPAPNAKFSVGGQRYVVFWSADRMYVQVRQVVQSTSGVANLKAILGVLAGLHDARGPVLGAHALLNFAKYGVEVVSGVHTATAGPMTFHLTRFSVTAN